MVVAVVVAWCKGFRTHNAADGIYDMLNDVLMMMTTTNDHNDDDDGGGLQLFNEIGRRRRFFFKVAGRHLMWGDPIICVLWWTHNRRF